jgi:hypothetical protein
MEGRCFAGVASMKLFLKLLFGGIFLWMTVMTIRTSLAMSLREAWPGYAANPWAVATLWDAYFGFFAARPASLSVAQIVNLIRADVLRAIAILWTATMHALVAWLAIGSLASLVIYLLLAPVLRKLGAALRAEAA